MKALLALVPLTMLGTAPPTVPSQPATAIPSPFYIDGNVIVRIVCITDKGTGVGTGTVVDANRIVTARHVIIKDATCAAEQSRVVLDGEQPGEDLVSVRSANAFDDRALIGCDGFTEGAQYVALGYALNSPKVVGQVLIGTDSTYGNGVMRFRGSVTPGMSGGPILDSRGRLVGIVNTYTEQGITFAGGTALKDTFLCKA